MDLTDAQRRAIEHDGRNLQLIACAGSGKTEVVARRVVHLLTPERPGSLEPRNIVAFTFTEKANNDDLRRRLDRSHAIRPCVPGTDSRQSPRPFLRFTGQVALIYGGLDYREREAQVELFRRPREDGGATCLVATDAAGEGINLQFCWLMINYDVPWNPARLEQRMGRIQAARPGRHRQPARRRDARGTGAQDAA